MKKKEGLHQLIHSLTASEKRYFKLFSQIQPGDKNYLLLFSEIEKQERYDEKAIRKKFEGQKFVKQMTVAKTYLYKLIMKSLRNYQQEDEIQVQVANLLVEAKVLTDRMLYHQAENMLAKALKLAENHNLFNYALEAVSMQLFIKGANAEYKTMPPLQRKQEELLKMQQNHIDISTILSQVRNITTAGGHQSDEKAMKQFGEIASSPVMASPECALTPLARWDWYIIRILIGSHLNRSREEALEWSERWVADMEKHPRAIENDPGNYYNACMALWAGLLAVGKYHKALEVIGQWENIEKKYGFKLTPILKRRFLAKSAMYRMMAYWGAEKFSEGAALLRSMDDERYLASLTPDVFFRYIFRFYGALNFFDLGLYKETGQQLRYILEEYDPEKMKDIQLQTRVLNLIVQYEFRNFRTVPYLVIAFKRWCKAEKISDKVITSFCSVIMQLCKHEGDTAKEKELLASWWFNDLDPISPPSTANFVFDSISVGDWLRRKEIIPA